MIKFTSYSIFKPFNPYTYETTSTRSLAILANRMLTRFRPDAIYASIIHGLKSEKNNNYLYSHRWLCCICRGKCSKRPAKSWTSPSVWFWIWTNSNGDRRRCSDKIRISFYIIINSSHLVITLLKEGTCEFIRSLHTATEHEWMNDTFIQTIVSVRWVSKETKKAT